MEPEATAPEANGPAPAADRERLAAELAEAREDLSVLAYVISHDLVAPLRAIDGYSALVRDEYGARLDEAGRLYLDYTRDAARRMARMLDGLTQLSRAMRHELRPAPADLGALAAEAVAALRAGSPQRAVTCVIQDGLRASVDPDLLRIALRHLLENAWKATAVRQDARVEVGARPGTEPTFYVRDNGIGFPPEQAGRLFQPLQRLHSEKDFPGAGVGLAIVRRIVRRHGGRVWAEASPGAGATFFFTLPD